jgi:hypothetical protein
MVTRICDEVVERPIYCDEIGITAYGATKGRNYLLQAPGDFKVELLFQTNGGVNPVINGLTNEILIAVIIDRITILNEVVPSRENERALDHLKDALSFLESRSIKRGQQQLSQPNCFNQHLT